MQYVILKVCVDACETQRRTGKKQPLHGIHIMDARFAGCKIACTPESGNLISTTWNTKKRLFSIHEQGKKEHKRKHERQKIDNNCVM